MGDRDAAEMRADADHDQPLVVAVLDAGLIGGRVLEIAERDLLGLLDLLLGPVHDVDWLAAPEHLDVLTVSDRGQIDLDRGTGRNRRGVRVHLGNEGPERGHPAHGCNGPSGNEEEITACRMVIRSRCRHDSKPFLKLAAGGTAPETSRLKPET
jgi:hypothetical protein